MHLLHFSTCFEQPRAHHQENQLYQYNIWYVSLCVGDLLVCRSGRNFLPDLHTRRSPTQSDTYQMLYWYNWFCWWWARGCSKHVEKWSKCIRIVRQVGYLQDMHQIARSAKHKIKLCSFNCVKNRTKNWTECSLTQHRFPIRFVSFFFFFCVFLYLWL
jgi:hypothetical protein